MTTIRIASKDIGDGHPCFVVAEVAQAHDGSLGTAHAYIDAISQTGVDAVKFQTHIAHAESTIFEPFRVRFSKQDASRYDYWKRMEFTEDQWQGLAAHAREKNLIFLSSPFSYEAVVLLKRIGVPAWKVGAGEITNLPMLKYVAETGLPVLLSTGMSSWSDIETAVTCLKDANVTYGIYQCVSAYPCPPEKLGLNILTELRRKYECPVGLSDHSGTIFGGLAAVALGANMLEIHVTFSRECFGPDVSSSITTEELKMLVTGTRFIEKALLNPVDKDVVAGEMYEMKMLFGKSVFTARDLMAGHIIEPKDLVLRKPGTGIPALRMNELIGRVLRRDISANKFIQEDDLE